MFCSTNADVAAVNVCAHEKYIIDKRGAIIMIDPGRPVTGDRSERNDKRLARATETRYVGFVDVGNTLLSTATADGLNGSPIAYAKPIFM